MMVTAAIKGHTSSFFSPWMINLDRCEVLSEDTAGMQNGEKQGRDWKEVIIFE